MDAVALTQELIRFESITPNDNGAMAYLAKVLTNLSFEVEIVEFAEPGHAPVKNLFAKYGEGASLCFAGHIDVVPAGEHNLWALPPFAGEIKDGVLYGRGAVDMKGAIGSFIEAAAQIVNKQKNTSISLMITGDEEASGINGTRKLLKYLADRGELFNLVIVGEPTNPNKIGEMIKIGRRGSVTFNIEVQGKQGHVAYPHLADNPITTLVKVLAKIKGHVLDSGNDYFQPSNLEIVDIEVGNSIDNLIPQKARARVNIRFNNLHSVASLELVVRSIIASETSSFTLTASAMPSEAFLTDNNDQVMVFANIVKAVTGIEPELSTTGGTSDARFIKDYAKVFEFGLVNKLAHKIDEGVAINDLVKLSKVYYEFMNKYFALAQ